MTIGVLWEFFEFGMDFFLGTDMQKDTVIHAIHSVSLDPTLSNKVVTIPDIQDVVINGESLGLGGYLDIGIIDTMKDLFVNFIGAVVFSLSGFFFARSKGRRKSAAQGFVPSKKTAEQDYLQQALEEADQKDADAPTPDGPPAPGEPGGCLSAPHRQKTTGRSRWFFAAAAGRCRPLLFDVTGFSRPAPALP